MDIFENLELIEYGKSDETELNQEIRDKILKNIRKFNYFALKNGVRIKESQNSPVTRLWALFGTNNINDFLSIVSRSDINFYDVLFYKVNIVNTETEIVEMTGEDVCKEKIFYSSQEEKNDLLAKILLFYLQSNKSAP